MRNTILIILLIAFLASCNFLPVGKSTVKAILEVNSFVGELSPIDMENAAKFIESKIEKQGLVGGNVSIIIENNKLIIELDKVSSPERVLALLQRRGVFGFYETYKFKEISAYVIDANDFLGEIQSQADSLKTGESENIAALIDSVEISETMNQDLYMKNNPLFAVLSPNYQNVQGKYFPSENATVGFSSATDTSQVNEMLKKVNHLFPPDLLFAWSVKPISEEVFELYALRVSSSQTMGPVLPGKMIEMARQDYDNLGNVEVAITMNEEGSELWKDITSENIGRQIAMVLDEYVYSCPRVVAEIPNGMSSISGNFTVEEALDLVAVLTAGSNYDTNLNFRLIESSIMK